MGMFDSIKINVEKLPVSLEEKIILKDVVYQTKDLEKCLMLYIISDDDELLLTESIRNNDGKVAGMYHDDDSDYKNDELIYTTVPYHGYISFYTSLDNVWYEFKAKFTDDKLVSIERIKKG